MRYFFKIVDADKCIKMRKKINGKIKWNVFWGQKSG